MVSSWPTSRLRRLRRCVLLVAVTVSLPSVDAEKGAQPAGEHGNAQHNIGAGDAAKDMDLEEWCAAKNSEIGPAVSRRLTEKSAWRPDPQPTLSATPIPGLSKGVPGTVVHDVLSPEECRELIAAYPDQSIAGYMPGERVAELYRDRKVKARAMAHDEKLADVLFRRLKEFIPAELDGGRLFRVNPGFRFVHYEQGGHHLTHIDGREPGVPTYNAEAGGWVQSRLTLQVYLNTHGADFEGGEFVVVQGESGNDKDNSTNVKHVVKPSAGDTVLFYQERLTPASEHPPYELNHEGRDVTRGEKFACRTMVDYIFPDKERAQMSNVRDDSIRRENAAALGAECAQRNAHRVLAIGNTIIDTMLTMPHFPTDGKAFVQTKKTYVGGQGANAAQAMALLGLNVSFLTRTGDDSDGSFGRDKYLSLGMDPSTNIIVPGCLTSSAYVVVGTEEMKRAALIYDQAKLHADRTFSDPVVAEAVRRVEAGEFAAVYSDGWQTDLALPIVRAAAKRGVPIVLDVEQITDDTKVMAEMAIALIANVPVIEELASHKGNLEEALRTLAGTRADRVVIATGGGEGSFGARGGDKQIIHIPALKADVRDTTGAGDAYHGGYMDAMVRGLGLRDAMAFATHVGAGKVEVPGPALNLETLQRRGVVRGDCT